MTLLYIVHMMQVW